ncbi:MAG: T9SS type A sorting domain-containing protein [Flavobacteriia bacterium]|nr:T9SS type A sorting domain-containing protein [Flavobacteriia bacterium]
MKSYLALVSKVVFFATLTLGSFTATASHMNGGWIHAEYDGTQNGKLRYILTLNLMYYTSGNPVSNTVIDVTNSNGSSTVAVNLTATAPYDNLHSLRVLTGIALLDANTDYTFSYEECCRSPAITNIASPITHGYYIWSELSTGQGNSLPVIVAPLNSVWPSGLNWRSSFRHTDRDGDSLSYSFSQVYELPSGGSTVTAIPMQPGWGTTASIPGSTIANDGMSFGSYTSSGQVTEYLVIGMQVGSYDLATGVQNGMIHYDILQSVRSFQGAWVKPVLISDSIMTFSDRFGFRVNRADTLDFYLFNERRWGDFHYPYWADPYVDIYQDDIRDSINGVNHKVTRLSVTPTPAQVGMKLPMVLRFDYGNYFNYDYHFDASIVSGLSTNTSELPSFNMYPNPAGGDHFTVESDGSLTALKIIDLTGRQVANYVLPEGVTEHSVSTPETPGVYLVMMLNGNQTLSTSRLVVE